MFFLVLFFGRVPHRVCTLFTGAHSCFLDVLILMSAAVKVAYRLTGQAGDVGTRQRHNRSPRAVAQAFAEKNGVGRLPVASLSPPLSSASATSLELRVRQLQLLLYAYGNFASPPSSFDRSPKRAPDQRLLDREAHYKNTDGPLVNR